MTESQITFETKDGSELLLEGVHYDVLIDGLMAKTTIAQNYSNPYDTNIEAVYTFPLSPDAVLLGIAVKINDRVLRGTIKEKSEAEAQYEEAIDDGNRAIMVEKSSDGIYTVNIANLLTKDTISVSIEYTQLLEWRQDQVKWSLPTTIAPKYGKQTDLNLDDVTDPSISLLAENLFSFNMRVKGVLADSDIHAPSHQIRIDKNEDQTLITLAHEKDFMDKDIVFTFQTQKSREERNFALVGKDFAGYAAIASFYPSFGSDLVRQPKSVTFVIDCSGSMQGVSIDRAKTALLKALHLFAEVDSFNIIKFGSHYSALFEREVPATQENLNIAKRMIRSLDADMGGTEMAEALQGAYAGHTSTKDKQGYLFLITDGEIYDHQRVIENAKKSEMAHYVVGVGYASDDALLRKVARETRGSYENIDPNEKMDDYILNLFKKIDTPKTIDISVQWPSQPKIHHHQNIIFDGDTFYAYGTFNDAPVGEIELEYTLENGNKYRSGIKIGQSDINEEELPSVVSKLVIAQEIGNISVQTKDDSLLEDTVDNERKMIIQYSTQYQLFSELTNYILVDEVAENEKPTSLTQMHQVDNMMSQSISVLRSCNRMVVGGYSNENEDILDLPCFLRKQMDSDDSSEIVFDSLNFEDVDTHAEQSSIENIWNSIDSSEYEHYLQLLNDWFVAHLRLPRKKLELTLVGFDLKTAGLFDKKNFRAQIKEFVMRLYLESGNHDNLNFTFIVYIKSKLLVKRLIRG